MCFSCRSNRFQSLKNKRRTNRRRKRKRMCQSQAQRIWSWWNTPQYLSYQVGCFFRGVDTPSTCVCVCDLMSLLLRTFPVLLSAFELFLTSLVKQEMSHMPRGVHFSAMRGGGLASAQGKTVAAIPAFMLKTHEKNKQPGLKSGLAGGHLHPSTLDGH